MHMVHDEHPAEAWRPPARSPGRPARAPIADYLDAFARYRWLLIGGPILAGVVAYGVALLLPPRFEATATLMVSASKTGDAVAPQSEARTFRAFLENQSLADQVVKEFKLGAQPYGLTPQYFLDHSVDVRELRGTSLLTLSVTLRDASLAARVANAMAEKAVALSRSLEQSESVVARDVIKSQLDGSRDRLTQARSALETFQRQSQVDLLEKQNQVLIDQQSELQRLLVEIRGERAYLAQAERDLAGQQPVRDVRRSVEIAPPNAADQRPGADRDHADPDSATRRARLSRDAPRDRADVAAAPGLRDTVVDPYINPSYEVLQQDVHRARSRLAQLEHERDELLRGRSKDGQVPALTTYYARKAAENELKMQQELAQKVYVDVATRYEQARLQIASRSTQLQIVDTALVPDRKVFPREKLIASAAAVLGFSLIAAMIVAVTALSLTLQPEAPADAETATP